MRYLNILYAKITVHTCITRYFPNDYSVCSFSYNKGNLFHDDYVYIDNMLPNYETNLVNDETYISNVLFQINVIQYFDFLASDYEIKLRYPYQTV